MGSFRRRARKAALGVAVGFVAALVAPLPAVATTYEDGSVFARVTAQRVVLGNDLVERSWSRQRFETQALIDRREGGLDWVLPAPDFSLTSGSLSYGGDQFRVAAVGVSHLDRGGLRVRMTLTGPPALPGATVTRTVEAYPGVAGFRTETTVRAPVPLALSAVSPERLKVGPAAAPTVNAFRAGADWREPGWAGPPISVGGSHPGDWRETTTAPAGQALSGPGQWLSMRSGRRTVFEVAEENDFPSSRAGYDGLTASMDSQYSRDVLDLGPFEEQAHAENPLGTPGRARVVRPGEPLVLPPVFTGVGTSPDDEAWQFHKYLVDHRLRPYPHAVTFNSNGTDDGRISTGAKDDMDLATVRQVAPIARRLGVETFILDDGWQARSGDWHPDSPQYPEPRWDGSSGSMFAPRFPDARFVAVRDAIAPMRLGLWMSPTFFNPSAQSFHEHPGWACQPIAAPLVADNLADPNGGSNEAGLGPWSAAALPFVEQRIRAAIRNWGVSYFKFDFLVWLDCAQSAGGVQDMYEFHDQFLAMLDRLRHAFPGVTFQIDETNDYRLFPFESVSRGPTWFQNGSPPPDRMLHNLWDLSPYLPTFALGQNALANEDFAHYPVDTLMATALLSQVTFFNDIRHLPDAVIARVADWTRFYEQSRDLFGGVVYPLLADPLDDGWTALQSWDPEAGRGALLAFRQSSDDPSRTIGLRNVPPGRSFDLYRAPDGDLVGTFSSAELTAGIPIDLPAKQDSEVLLIEPHP